MPLVRDPQTGQKVSVPSEFVIEDQSGDNNQIDWDGYHAALAGNMVAYDEEGRVFMKTLPSGISPEDAAKWGSYSGALNWMYQDRSVTPLGWNFGDLSPTEQAYQREAFGSTGLPGALEDYFLDLSEGDVSAKNTLGQTIGGVGGQYLPTDVQRAMAAYGIDENIIDKAGMLNIGKALPEIETEDLTRGLAAEAGALKSVTPSKTVTTKNPPPSLFGQGVGALAALGGLKDAFAT